MRVRLVTFLMRGALALLVCALALAARSEAPTSRAAGTFNPAVTLALSSTAPGANADLTIAFSLPSGDVTGSSLTFIPAESSISPGPASIASGLGDVVATASAANAVGFLNGPCNSSITVPFTLLNSTIDNSAGNLIDPLPQAAAGSEGVLAPLRDDTGGGAPSNGLPAYVDRYPSFLNTLFTPDGGSPVQPLARYAGSTSVNGLAVVAQLLVFSPGALGAFAAPDPLSDAAGLGYVGVTVLNDPTQAPVPGPVTDLCTPLTLSATLWGITKTNPCAGNTASPCNTDAGISAPTPGAPTGRARYTNPSAARTYLFGGLITSARDADGDGIENPLDSCPYTPTPSYDPRSFDLADDGDFDMIPGGGAAGGCDPTPGTNSGSGNHDGDAAPNASSWPNAADNCPLLANSTNADTEDTLAANVATYRGGPASDFIGDACDINPTKADGIFFTRLVLVPKCIGGTDADGDGWCAATTPASLNDPNDSNAGRTPEDYDLVFPFHIAHSGSGATPPQREPPQVCDDGIDNDGDTLVDTLDSGAGPGTCRPKGLSTGDTDGDGFADEAEMWIGTDTLGRCEVGAVPSTSTDWPPDLVSGGIPSGTDRITIQDVTALLAPSRALDTSPGHPNYTRRKDLVPGPGILAAWINIADVTSMVAGSTGSPPMFGGAVKALNGPTCTAHPFYGD